MRTTSNDVSNPYYAYGVLYKSDNFQRWENSKGPRYSAYRQDWTDRVSALNPGDFPLNLNIEVTTRCNLACTFCTHRSLRPDQIGDISFEQCKKLIDEGKHYDLPTININGLGEPLLWKDMVRLIRYAKEQGVVDVMFHTNGTIMTEKLAKDLITAGLDRIICSVDSPDKETYESMRILHASYEKCKGKKDCIPKGASWEKTVGNVRCFIDIRNQLGNNAPIVRVTMVVTDKTVHQVNDLLKLWKPTVDHITVQDLTWRSKLLDGGSWKNKETTALSTDFNEIRDEAIRKKIAFVCPYLYQSIYQFFGGDLIPCGNPNARTHMVMGSWENQTIHEVWTSEEYRELRKLHQAGLWHEHPICRDCEVVLVELYKDMTKSGVKFTSDAHPNGNIQKRNVLCEGASHLRR